MSANASVIVLDMILPDLSGIQFLEQLKIRRPDGPSVIAITGATEAAIPDSIIEAPRGRHSEKPAAVRELIDRMYPHASKLELFARGKAPEGWRFWGNQAEAPETGEE